MKKRVFLALSLFVSIIGYSQIEYKTENTDYIYWQPKTIIKKSDYLGDTIDKKHLIDQCKEFNIGAMACIGLHSVLDIPKRRRYRGKMYEKVYFAPAFQKTCSFIYLFDSLDLAKQRIYFDICELAARKARKKLYNLRDSMNAYGTLSTFYFTVDTSVKETQKEMNYHYTQEVYIQNLDSAYQKWRSVIDKMLLETNDFATTDEECHRFLTKNH